MVWEGAGQESMWSMSKQVCKIKHRDTRPGSWTCWCSSRSSPCFRRSSRTSSARRSSRTSSARRCSRSCCARRSSRRSSARTSWPSQEVENPERGGVAKGARSLFGSHFFIFHFNHLNFWYCGRNGLLVKYVNFGSHTQPPSSWTPSFMPPFWPNFYFLSKASHIYLYHIYLVLWLVTI